MDDDMDDIPPEALEDFEEYAEDYEHYADIEQEMEMEMEGKSSGNEAALHHQDSNNAVKSSTGQLQPSVDTTAQVAPSQTAAASKVKPSDTTSAVASTPATIGSANDAAALAKLLRRPAARHQDPAVTAKRSTKNATSDVVVARDVSADNLASGVLLSHPPTDGTQTLDIKLGSGMFFMPFRPESAPSGPAPDAQASLLSSPIEVILAEVNRQRLEDARRGLDLGKDVAARAAAMLAEADALLADSAASSSAPVVIDDDEGEDDDDDVMDMAQPSTGAGGSATGLWVDKYAARSYIHLLSDERINRNVLRWIKVWDGRVFGRPVHIEQHATASASTGQGQGKDAFGRYGAGGNAGSSASTTPGQGQGQPRGHAKDSIFAQFGYGWNPYAKALLLCGPPGMGKTTLAHIAARQAGYKTIEINASDERTGETIRNRISAAQGMNSVTGDKKPVCVILDECDGLDGPAIAELVKMINATPSLAPKSNSSASWRQSNGDKDGAGDDDGDSGDEGQGAWAGAGAGGAGKRKRASKKEGRGGGDKDGRAQPLTRPLICICNDQYAPALRELRPLVQLVEFDRIDGGRLLSRLRHICKEEGLVATDDALDSLIRATDSDIRACLNTLQFIRSQVKGPQARSKGLGLGRTRVTTEIVVRASVGCKDQTKAVMGVWQEVLNRKPAYKLGSVASGADRIRAAVGSGRTGASAAYADLFNNLSGYSSEARLLLAGLHENLYEGGVSDPVLEHTVAALDWLCYGEELNSKTGGSGVQALGKYIALAGLGIHVHMASDQKCRPKWPAKDARVRTTGEARRAILHDFRTAKAQAPTPQALLKGEVGSVCSSGGSGGLSLSVMVQDVVSPLLSILSPPLRAVNFTLYNSRERDDAQALIQTLVSLGMGYSGRMAKGKDGGNAQDRDDNYGLQPDLPRLVEYEGYEAWEVPGHRGSPLHPLLMSMLSSEVRQARMSAAWRDREAQEQEQDMQEGATPDKAAVVAAVALPEHVKRQLAASGVTGSELANLLHGGGDGVGAGAAPVESALPEEPKMSKQMSFLAEAAIRSRGLELARKRTAIATAAGASGAPAPSAPSSSTSSGAGAGSSSSSTAAKCKVLFKFQEGFTNAVRRPVTLKDFV